VENGDSTPRLVHPVVLGGQSWLTTATQEGHDCFALCVDAETGKIRFNEKVFHTDNPEPLATAPR